MLVPLDVYSILRTMLSVDADGKICLMYFILQVPEPAFIAARVNRQSLALFRHDMVDQQNTIRTKITILVGRRIRTVEYHSRVVHPGY